MKILRKVGMVVDSKVQKKADSYKWESTASMVLGNLMRLKDFSGKITDPVEAKSLLSKIRGDISWQINLIEDNLRDVK